jgi:alkylated DNA repair dioxygenase AlkB
MNNATTMTAGTFPSCEVVDLTGGGRVVLHRGWMNAARSGEMFEALASAPWTQRVVRIYGREIPQPRLTAWWGDVGATYTYSGIRNVPQPWPAWMEHLRSELTRELGIHFNSCLGNLYRDGRDSVALHADDEPELGPEPTIASLSLGGSRKFQLRHATAASIDLMLDDGDLLVMSGLMQREWKHGIPKARTAEPRINLTFRHVTTRSD